MPRSTFKVAAYIVKRIWIHVRLQMISVKCEITNCRRSARATIESLDANWVYLLYCYIIFEVTNTTDTCKRAPSSLLLEGVWTKHTHIWWVCDPSWLGTQYNKDIQDRDNLATTKHAKMISNNIGNMESNTDRDNLATTKHAKMISNNMGNMDSNILYIYKYIYRIYFYVICERCSRGYPKNRSQACKTAGRI